MSSLLGRNIAEEPLPAFYPLYARRFRWLVSKLMHGLFHEVSWMGGQDSREVNLDSPSVVLYANHPSFWDPLVLALLTERLFPNHAVFAPIETQALRRHPYFRGLGFFEIDIGSVRGLSRFKQVARAALGGSLPSCLVLTPEGKFSDPRTETIQLKRGLSHALANLRGPTVEILPVALDYRLGPHPRPQAFITLGEPLAWTGEAETSEADLHRGLTDRLRSALEKQRQLIGTGRPGRPLKETP